MSLISYRQSCILSDHTLNVATMQILHEGHYGSNLGATDRDQRDSGKSIQTHQHLRLSNGPQHFQYFCELVFFSFFIIKDHETIHSTACEAMSEIEMLSALHMKQGICLRLMRYDCLLIGFRPSLIILYICSWFLQVSIPVPNVDTLYGGGYLDLSDTPMVMSLPQFKNKRYWRWAWIISRGSMRRGSPSTDLIKLKYLKAHTYRCDHSCRWLRE